MPRSNPERNLDGDLRLRLHPEHSAPAAPTAGPRELWGQRLQFTKIQLP